MKRIYKINDNKFKGIDISYNFTLPIQKDQIVKDNMILSLLSKGCKKYDSESKIDMFLSEMYGAKFDTNVEKIGDLYNIEFNVEFVNREFLPNKFDPLDKILNFLESIIYEPVTVDGYFKKTDIEHEKDIIKDIINTKKDDKLKYAVNKAEELVCSNEPYGVYLYGNIEDVDNVDEKNAYERYRYILDNSIITVIVSGNLTEYDEIDKKIDNIFSAKLNENITYDNINLASSFKFDLKDNIEEVKEKFDVEQSVISLGFRIKNFNVEDTYSLLVYNAILGSTPSSKLFQNVREKKSLAYTIQSRYYRFKSMIIIYAGIEQKNYEYAKESILKEIKDIENSVISSQEFEAAKQSVLSDILQWKDYKRALLKFKFTNLLNYKSDYMDIDKFLEKINSVTLNDILEVSKKIKLQLIFFLGGDNNE